MIDPTLREWCFAREMLRRIGFTPDEIFFGVREAGEPITENGVTYTCEHPMAMLQLQTQGKTFNWTIGPVVMSRDQIEIEYQKVCARWNAGDEEAFSMEHFFASRPFAMRIELVTQLYAKGFAFTPEAN